MVSVTVGEGAHVETIEVHNHVHQLSEDKKILKAVSQTLAPIERSDYRRIDFKKDDVVVKSIPKQEAAAILKTCQWARPEPEEQAPQEVIAHLRPYSPVFDAKAENWRFWYGEKTRPLCAIHGEI